MDLARIHKFQLPVASEIRQCEPLYSVDPPSRVNAKFSAEAEVICLKFHFNRLCCVLFFTGSSALQQVSR